MLTGLSDTHFAQLQCFHISSLRKLQSLPERTASSVVQLLLGALPIQADLNKRQLSLFHSVICSWNQRIKGLMERRLTLRYPKSFFCTAEKTLKMYDLPSTMELQNLSKLAGKRLTRQAVNSYWTQSLIREAQTKWTLEHCDEPSMTVGNTHIV